MPKIVDDNEPKRIAAIYWYTRSVGGIATRLNNLRLTAMSQGDHCDVLISKVNTTKPQIYKERRWTWGGDSKIWVDGCAPQGQNWKQTVKWLEDNYDGIVFGFLCPHPCQHYPNPEFLKFYEQCKLPKIAFISDGFWSKYKEWGLQAIPHLKQLFCVQDGYGQYLRDEGIDIEFLPNLFVPRAESGTQDIRSETPLLIWPNQWKNIKGITEFINIVPDLPKQVQVEFYSDGIRHYQLRTSEIWKRVISENHHNPKYAGKGRHPYIGNVDIPQMLDAYKRAWFTVNLQGLSGKKYGIYHFTEIEALYYGACPIVHSSVAETAIPKDIYLRVDSADEIPNLVKFHIANPTKFVLSPKRQKLAREFIEKVHHPVRYYERIKRALFD